MLPKRDAVAPLAAKTTAGDCGAVSLSRFDCEAIVKEVLAREKAKR